MLAELKIYLQSNQIASLEDMALHFATDKNTIKDMLDVWMRKGKVRKVQNINSSCSKCIECSQSTSEIYEWID